MNSHYLQCGHVETKLTPCPSYRKQKSSARGFWGSLFKGNTKSKKHCGKLIPHPLEQDGYCQDCAIRWNEGLQTQYVGEGAFRVHKTAMEDSFRDERKHAAKKSLKKSERQHRDGHKGRHHHEVINAKPSVWLPELYHHPETLARREEYARAPAAAPPVSSRSHKSSRQHHSSRTHEPRTVYRESKRERNLKRNYDYVSHESAPGTLSVSAGRTPAFGGSQPLMRPAEPAPTHLYAGRFGAANAAALPPAYGLPPMPYKPARPPRPDEYESSSSDEYTVPEPAYQVYLNAMAASTPTHAEKVAAMMKRHAAAEKAAPTGPPRDADGNIDTRLDPRWRYYQEPKKSRFHTLAGMARGNPSPASTDDGSDVSFYCSGDLASRQTAALARHGGRR
ncbi:Uu.00g014590.m01.CDS01 [Anthostomella pinea]|uniref:Uu.00g014590.m01.CDS01 n=1 Tax=Anthostomella pinea TaxID=933095 RepID=A0AAI8YQE0_9PEZI|nr:Uu.00g014590.m01.CDS01 [Anthostomella pinea]